jgi:hypothetical protein
VRQLLLRIVDEPSVHAVLIAEIDIVLVAPSRNVK